MIVVPVYIWFSFDRVRAFSRIIAILIFYHAGMAEPYRISPPEAAAYLNGIN
jgi:hypothetical protein